MRLAVPLLFVLLIPSICHAWGGEAHQIIALIAEDHLTPEAKAAVKDLLDGANISDAEVASWADEVKRTDRRDTADWQYVNIPVDDRKGQTFLVIGGSVLGGGVKRRPFTYAARNRYVASRCSSGP